MNAVRPTGLLAADVGSSRIKLGWFSPKSECTSDKSASQLPIAAPALPEPGETLTLNHRELSAEQWAAELQHWTETCLPEDFPSSVAASVHGEAGATLRATLTAIGGKACQELRRDQLPLNVNVAQPDQVGIDRLLNALAVGRLVDVASPAIVVDAGTATTVDVVAGGAFQGGAILPGPSLALAALHGGTATLPLLTTESFRAPPDPIGKSTELAIAAGVFWSFVGGVRQLVELQAARLQGVPRIFVTGGASAPLVAALATHGHAVTRLPHLTLAGIAVAVEESSGT